MPNGTIKQNMQNIRIREVEARMANLEQRMSTLANSMVKITEQLFDLRMGAKHAEASMRQVRTVLSAQEERVRMGGDETARRSTGTARNGSS